jgi:hypothetical protein
VHKQSQLRSPNANSSQDIKSQLCSRASSLQQTSSAVFIRTLAVGLAGKLCREAGTRTRRSFLVSPSHGSSSEMWRCGGSHVSWFRLSRHQPERIAHEIETHMGSPQNPKFTKSKGLSRMSKSNTRKLTALCASEHNQLLSWTCPVWGQSKLHEPGVWEQMQEAGVTLVRTYLRVSSDFFRGSGRARETFLVAPGTLQV